MPTGEVFGAARCRSRHGTSMPLRHNVIRHSDVLRVGVRTAGAWPIGVAGVAEGFVVPVRDADGLGANDARREEFNFVDGAAEWGTYFGAAAVKPLSPKTRIASSDSQRVCAAGSPSPACGSDGPSGPRFRVHGPGVHSDAEYQYPCATVQFVTVTYCGRERRWKRGRRNAFGVTGGVLLSRAGCG